MTIACVDLQTLAIVSWYDGDAIRQNEWGGSMGDPSLTLHTLVPEGLTWDTVMATRDDSGEIVLLEDPTKLAAKTQAQWASVRAQQRELLYKSDWTCSVTDYEVPNKSEWVQYRAALRDVTSQADPFNISWPSPPSSA
jgi:hypothetical protein